MSKKCKKCGAPIKGFWSVFSALAGVRQSKKNPDYCNKCVDSVEGQNKVVEEQEKKQNSQQAQPKDIYEAEADLKKLKNQEQKEEKWAEKLEDIHEKVEEK